MPRKATVHAPVSAPVVVRVVSDVPVKENGPESTPWQTALAKRGKVLVRFSEYGVRWESTYTLTTDEHIRVDRCMRVMWLDVLRPHGLQTGTIETDEHLADLVIVRNPEGVGVVGVFWPKIVLEG